MHDDPLGLNQSGPPMPEAWTLPQMEPTNLIALWADDQAPTQSEVVAALQSQWDGVEVQEDIDPEDPNVLWVIALDTPLMPQPVVVWCEPARPLPPGELDDPMAESCKWVIGCETMLDPADPLRSYQNLVRFIATALPEIVGILDINTTGWLRRSVIEEQFLPEDNSPPIEVLWIVHAVSPQERETDGGGIWLHTHGLWRCGRPELEMLEVQEKFVASAGRLVNEVAERILDDEPPKPGIPFLIGENLGITLHPWQNIAPLVAKGMPGGMTDREEDPDQMHVGVRAVICDEQPAGTHDKTWIWPKRTIERLEKDEAVIWKSPRSTGRLSKQARFTWGELATAFATLRPYLTPARDDALAMVMVKASFQNEPGDSDDDGGEHMWLEALRFEGERVEGRLLNQPLHMTGIQRNDLIWIDRDRLSDWAVQTEFGMFSPSNVAGMWRAVDQITQEAAKP